jgi:hypothetical protein
MITDHYSIEKATRYPSSMERARAITDSLMKHRFATIFLEPVDPIRDHAPDYHDVIKNPMDLQTISRKLNENAYANWQAWAADVELIFDNCVTYNGDSIFGDIAKFMKVHFQKLLIPLKLQNYEGWIEESQHIFQRVTTCLKNPPTILKKTLSGGIEDPRDTFSEPELENLALKLSLLNAPDVFPVFQILAIFGVDLWGAKGRKAELNIKTLPAPAIQTLATYVKELSMKQKS